MTRYKSSCPDGVGPGRVTPDSARGNKYRMRLNDISQLIRRAAGFALKPESIENFKQIQLLLEVIAYREAWPTNLPTALMPQPPRSVRIELRINGKNIEYVDLQELAK